MRTGKIETRTRRIGHESKLAAAEVGEALRRLARDVRQAYEHVRRAL